MIASMLGTLEKSVKVFIKQPILLVIPFFPAVVSLASWLIAQSAIKGYLNNAHSSIIVTLFHFVTLFSYILFSSILMIFIESYYKKIPFFEVFHDIYSNRALEIIAACFAISVTIEIGLKLFVLPGLVVIFFSLFIIPFMVIGKLGIMRSVRMSIYFSKKYWETVLIYAIVLIALSIIVSGIFSILGVVGNFIATWIIYGYSASVLLNIYLLLQDKYELFIYES
ncbi:MAG: hypothetical protein GXP60_02525 [Epsilonproteobacteria bacterium]|nr:hypothetical protein [Campylobacterota bacterium]